MHICVSPSGQFNERRATYSKRTLVDWLTVGLTREEIRRRRDAQRRAFAIVLGHVSRRQRKRTDSKKWLPALKRTLPPTLFQCLSKKPGEAPPLSRHFSLSTCLSQAPEKPTLFTSPGTSHPVSWEAQVLSSCKDATGRSGQELEASRESTPIPQRQRTEQSPKC